MRRFLHDRRAGSSPQMATHRRADGFTLIELLVVIGILGLLAILTVISAQKLSKSSRVSAATNAVTSTLQVARAYAIREGKFTAVVCRASWDINNKQRPQQTEIVVAASTGETFKFSPPGQLIPDLSERFVPVTGIKAVRLPVGVKVAGPNFEFNRDDEWLTQGEMPLLMNGCRETNAYSAILAVLFAPDGSVVSANTRAGAADMKGFLDFSNSDADSNGDPQDVAFGTCPIETDYGNYPFWCPNHADDECNFFVTPFLAVYDDRAAREVKLLDWTDKANAKAELYGPTGYISTNGQRIHFNRYTGVAEVQQ